MEPVFLDNPLAAWARALAIAAGVFLLLVFLRLGLLALLKNTTNLKTTRRLVEGFSPFTSLAIGLVVARYFLSLPDSVNTGLRLFTISVFSIQAAHWAILAFDHTLKPRMEQMAEADPSRRDSLLFFQGFLRVLVWSLALLVILENIPNFNVSSLITGLGIGGLAISLASQKLISDLLSSLTIRWDKPFITDEVIRASGFTGTVTQIGLRSTRIRNLTGEELIFSNSDLLSTPIQNMSRMQERRVEEKIFLSLNNQPEKLDQLPALIAGEVAEIPNLRFERAYLKGLTNLDILCEYSYFVTSPRSSLKHATPSTWRSWPPCKPKAINCAVSTSRRMPPLQQIRPNRPPNFRKTPEPAPPLASRPPG